MPFTLVRKLSFINLYFFLVHQFHHHFNFFFEFVLPSSFPCTFHQPFSPSHDLSLISPSLEPPTLSPSHSHPFCMTLLPSYLKDFHCYSIISHTSFLIFSFSDVLGYAKLSSSHRALINAISSHVESISFSQVVVIPKWHQTMQNELQALK